MHLYVYVCIYVIIALYYMSAVCDCNRCLCCILQNSWTACILAAGNGHREIVQMLIAANADLDLQDKVVCDRQGIV